MQDDVKNGLNTNGLDTNALDMNALDSKTPEANLAAANLAGANSTVTYSTANSTGTNSGATNSGAPNSMDMLMHVEVPVSISFGSTKIRMRELLNLTSGSVVELDQTLGDRVEICVNNSVIATGEVVAVDGNYGVRILELVSGPSAAALNGSTK